jgi:hypothetical protein
MAEVDTGMKLVLLAGGLTFANETIQTKFDIKQVNWRVPVATLLAAAATAGIGRVSPGGAAALGLMALIVAAATPLDGKSPIQQIGALVNGSSSTVKTKVTATAV